MKLVSYKHQSQYRSGLWIDGKVYDLQQAAKQLGMDVQPTMLDLLKMEAPGMEIARKAEQAIIEEKADQEIQNPTLVAPIPNPPSCRDAYAFRQHVATARRNRGVPMIPEFDQFPVFYFTNHNAIFGPGEITVEDDHLHKLDFELEVAAVMGKRGKNISSAQADQYIAGFTIMNDFSARLLQMEEMKLNLGPAKGKDFATTIGPWLVTLDELETARIDSKTGVSYDLKMEGFHNGKKISSGNMKDMNWTFAEIIERVSYGAEIFPGDVIGSGTVGTGCYLELNGTWALEAKEKGEDFTPVWLQDGDTMELKIDRLGTLTNKIVKSRTPLSILSKKKTARA